MLPTTQKTALHAAVSAMEFLLSQYFPIGFSPWLFYCDQGPRIGHQISYQLLAECVPTFDCYESVATAEFRLRYLRAAVHLYIALNGLASILAT